MEQRVLGRSGVAVSAIGLGCMSMSDVYGPADEAESVRTIHRALDLGVTLLDTGSSYGFGENERLIGRTIASRRDQVVLATKFGGVRDRETGQWRLEGRPEWVRRFCDESLGRLGVDHLDLYYMSWRNPEIPVEDTVGAMAELAAAGKVRHLGVAEVSAETIRRACAVHPIAALQSEYSLWTRGLEAGILPAARALGLGLVPYSPLGRGFVAGAIGSGADLGEGDFRRALPRFQGENLRSNLALLDGVRAVAAEVGATAARVSLAWVLAQGDDVVPIPGTRRVAHVEQNAAAAGLVLTPDQLRRLTRSVPPEAVAGARYNDAGMAGVEN